MSTTLSGHRTHHKDGAKLFAYRGLCAVVGGAGSVVVVVDEVVDVVGRTRVVVVVLGGLTVDDVEEVEELEVLVELVDDVDPRFVPSSVG